MNFKYFFTLILIGISTPGFTQSNPELAKKIEDLAAQVIKNIHSEDIFIKTGRSSIGSADFQELRKIVMSNGFPTISVVGKEASHKFWMMVQLCDFDIQFQVAVLKQMGRAVRNGNANKEDYAMLTDRTRMNRKLPQLYGTQYVQNTEGQVILYPVFDQGNVNDRRKTLNLPKFEEVRTPEIWTAKGGAEKRTDPDDNPNN